MSEFTLDDIREGSIVMVAKDFGSGKVVKAEVEEVCEDIKNGRPGFDYVILSTKEQKWAYLSQLVKVLEY